MRSTLTTTAISLVAALSAAPGLAAEEAPWKAPNWEPITEEERQPVTPEEIAASEVKTQENREVRYLTGGLGAAERAWLEEHGASYPVVLMFSKGKRGAFVSSVQVTIRSRNGQTQFEATTDGPLIYIDLPNGQYEATASYREQERTFGLRVRANGRTSLSINFP